MNMTSPHHPLQVGGPLHLVRGCSGSKTEGYTPVPCIKCEQWDALGTGHPTSLLAPD